VCCYLETEPTDFIPTNVPLVQVSVTLSPTLAARLIRSSKTGLNEHVRPPALMLPPEMSLIRPVALVVSPLGPPPEKIVPIE
jgi:hypothetical protein